MKVNSNRDISFTSIYTNKTLKKGLEFAADNGALFAATTTLLLSAGARPAAIWLAPHTDKENKKVACAKSISSSGAGYLLTLGVSAPFTSSIKKIDESPRKYLKPETIKYLKNGSEKLYQSKSYTLATQLFKLGLGLVVAIPKAILTCAGMPFIMQKLFHTPKPQNKERENLTFKGRGRENFTRGIGKILDTKCMQKFADKYKDSNFPMHIVAATDALTTAAFIHETNRSEKIEERRKKALIYNAGISTGLSIISSYILDKLTEKPTQKFIQKFKEVNKGLPNLDKQVEGIKIAKPIILVGCVYYMFIPFISTFLADIADHNPKLDIPHKGKQHSKTKNTGNNCKQI